MLHAPKGLYAFFRAYYFYKSADYKGNNPHPLKARTAEEMAQIPTYYVIEKDKGMAETVAPFMPSAEYIATFSGRSIDVSSQFIAGKSDWGVYQTPGGVEKMHKSACTRMVASCRWRRALGAAGAAETREGITHSIPARLRKVLIARSFPDLGIAANFNRAVRP